MNHSIVVLACWVCRSKTKDWNLLTARMGWHQVLVFLKASSISLIPNISMSA